MANQSETRESGPFEIPINQPELFWIELFRTALGEETNPQRLAAILSVKHDVIAARLENLLRDPRSKAPQRTNIELLEWIARTQSERHEAVSIPAACIDLCPVKCPGLHCSLEIGNPLLQFFHDLFGFLDFVGKRFQRLSFLCRFAPLICL